MARFTVGEIAEVWSNGTHSEIGWRDCEITELPGAWPEYPDRYEADIPGVIGPAGHSRFFCRPQDLRKKRPPEEERNWAQEFMDHYVSDTKWIEDEKIPDHPEHVNCRCVAIPVCGDEHV